MKRTASTWTLQDLRKKVFQIDFPEFQREPNIWSRDAKQRLIDSLVREFDIASLYLYEVEEGQYECIDGRQRIGALLSFLGENPKDVDDNGFPFRILNEIYEDKGHRFEGLNGLIWADIYTRAENNDADAQQFVKAVLEYPITVILLSEIREQAEFNLQFARLNLGTIINSGEKLHAMVGYLRDACFGTDGLGSHEFLRRAKIPERRFSREQLAAQILAQALAIEDTGDFTRTRHFDLQRLFKEKARPDEKTRQVVDAVRKTLDILLNSFASPAIFTNRATLVSVVVAALLERVDDSTGPNYAAFVGEFLCRLRWQLSKGLGVDQEFSYLVDFQRHLTQASVEKPAVKARHEELTRQYHNYLNSGVLDGDDDYLKRTGRRASVDCTDALGTSN